MNSCIKAAVDFVSPEHLPQCFNLMEQFRQLSSTHQNHEDKLQVKNMLFHGIKDALSVILTSSSALGDRPTDRCIAPTTLAEKMAVYDSAGIRSPFSAPTSDESGDRESLRSSKLLAKVRGRPGRPKLLGPSNPLPHSKPPQDVLSGVYVQPKKEEEEEGRQNPSMRVNQMPVTYGRSDESSVHGVPSMTYKQCERS